MRTSSAHELVTEGFISYRRDDNTDFDGVVDEIKQKLSAMFEAQTGQRINFFVDRESIGWGEDWRAKIENSVRKATVFIPIITLRYFNSQACLDELLAFEATARSLGVTDLIPPIVLFGAEQISGDDERPEVRLIARLNYKSIEEAWKAGYQSAKWRQVLSDCAKSLADALKRAEDALASSEGEAAVLAASIHPGSATQDTDEGPDVDLMAERMEQVTAKLNEATKIFEELAEPASQFGEIDTSGMSQSQITAKLLATAREMSEPARRLEVVGAEAEAAMLEIDPQLRELVGQLSGMSLPLAQEQALQLTAATGGSNLEEVEAGIAEFIEMVQYISLMNVSIRKALRPAVRGLRSFQSALRIFRSWEDLLD